MSYRCVDPFVTAAGQVYPGGCSVSDSDPILQSHAGHFARVDESIQSARTETATAAPGEHRAAKKAPAKKAAPQPEPKTDKPEGGTDA